MPVLLTQDLPFPHNQLEALSAEMGVRENPPAGLILHLVTETPAGSHVVDVWESAEHFDEFRRTHLDPAIDKVMAERGEARPQGILEPVITPAYDVIRGR